MQTVIEWIDETSESVRTLCITGVCCVLLVCVIGVAIYIFLKKQGYI